MTKPTHIVSGITFSIIPIVMNPISALGLIGSLFPDVDIKLGIKHRTITHSLFFVVIISLLVYLLIPNIALVFFLSSLSHLIADSLTISGVPFFYPFYRKYYKCKLVKTGSNEEYGVAGIMAIIALIELSLLFKINITANR